MSIGDAAGYTHFPKLVLSRQVLFFILNAMCGTQTNLVKNIWESSIYMDSVNFRRVIDASYRAEESRKYAVTRTRTVRIRVAAKLRICFIDLN